MIRRKIIGATDSVVKHKTRKYINNHNAEVVFELLHELGNEPCSSNVSS
jgi:hypothetical protein